MERRETALFVFVGSASRLLASINALATIWTDGWPACWTLGLTLTDIKMKNLLYLLSDLRATCVQQS